MHKLTDHRFHFEPTTITNPPSSTDDSRLHQFGKKVLTGFSHMLCVTCGERIVRVLASEVHVKILKHQLVAQEETPSFPCAHGTFKL